MANKIYEGLRRLLRLGTADAIEGNVDKRLHEELPESSEQIKVLHTPIGYIRDGERILQEKYRRTFGMRG